MDAVDAVGAYCELEARFPLTRAGYGVEPRFPGTAAQPMTYALVAMAGARAPVTQDDRGRRSARWLLRHADLDRDRRPGWGIPHAYDAFADGRGAAGAFNPPHHPYTITTAFALQALSAAMTAGWLEGVDRARAVAICGSVAQRWTNEVQSAGEAGVFFWYSPHEADAKFCPNVSAMMAGAIREARFVGLVTEGEPAVDEIVDAAVTELVTVARDDEPMYPAWSYIHGDERPRTNDAVHHAYTIWGLERYRSSGGQVPIPWTTEAAAHSCQAYFHDGFFAETPRTGPDESPAAARLWGAGMCLSVVARHGSVDEAVAMAEAIAHLYGSPSGPRLRPDAPAVMYPRHAAHVLLGLAELACRVAGSDTRP